jgi:hypothetical protein
VAAGRTGTVLTGDKAAPALASYGVLALNPFFSASIWVHRPSQKKYIYGYTVVFIKHGRIPADLVVNAHCKTAFDDVVFVNNQRQSRSTICKQQVKS